MTIIINAQGSERKRLVQTISTWLDLPPQYCGAPSFSYKVGCITIDKTGSLVISDGLSEDAIERLTDRLTLRTAVEKLSERDRAILRLRYEKELSQQQTAAILGLSQVKISRTEKKIFAFLREQMG